MASTYSLPWGSSTSPKSTGAPSNAKDDSAYQEEPEYSNSGHEYSNPESSYESGYNPSTEPEYSNTSGSSDSCPDYEEVTEQQHQKLFRFPPQQQQLQERPPSGKGLVYNLASEGIFSCQRAQTHGGDLHLDSSDPVTKEKIMNSLIYCIHKVGSIYST